MLGVSLAYHLGKARQRVLVLEREPIPAAHASGKNAGMIRQLYHHPQLSDWTRRSIELWPEEIRNTYFRQSGSMIVGREIPQHHEGLFEQRSFRLMNAGKSFVLPSVYTATDGLLDSPGYVNALVAACDREYVRFQFRTTVQTVGKKGDDWIVHSETNETFSTAWLVNAAGAWVNEPLDEHCPTSQVDTRPYARHLFLMSGWEEDYMPVPECGFFWEEHHGWYVRQWDRKNRLISICDRTVVDSLDSFVPKNDVRENLAEKLLDSLPSAAEKAKLARSWHCFRTYTEDQLPIWGEDQNLSGLFWLAAFGGFGMSTSFAATADAALYLLGKKVEVTTDFLPGRVQNSASPEKKLAIL